MERTGVERKVLGLTALERKERLPYGAQKEVAEELARLGPFEGSCTPSYVSEVVNGEHTPKTPRAKERLRLCQLALARRMRPRVAVDIAFPPVRKELARAS